MNSTTKAFLYLLQEFPSKRHKTSNTPSRFCDVICPMHKREVVHVFGIISAPRDKLLPFYTVGCSVLKNARASQMKNIDIAHTVYEQRLRNNQVADKLLVLTLIKLKRLQQIELTLPFSCYGFRKLLNGRDKCFMIPCMTFLVSLRPRDFKQGHADIEKLRPTSFEGTSF